MLFFPIVFSQSLRVCVCVFGCVCQKPTKTNLYMYIYTLYCIVFSQSLCMCVCVCIVRCLLYVACWLDFRLWHRLVASSFLKVNLKYFLDYVQPRDCGSQST